eukprot:CAMPEP_0201595306 /NCGR_PEP_ID=MMETSP0190_2-20130828/192352_1 /ASSEMBLY_ACC=CAM_ASM_000263 /TAXON_ID=37353 /ORGANISM="Rosalina sp." /LENGTH=494 /DNA_ID=CAMNT_0048055245 /DNA_START=14 /DNA_END=1496 /DNA_ORIENTATION=-
MAIISFCDCPYCSCETKDEAGESQEVYKYGDGDGPFGGSPSQTCYNCTCETRTSDGIDVLVYQCDDDDNDNGPFDWNFFSCPPKTCTYPDPNSNELTTITAGNGYFDNVDSNEKCDKFCYCGADGGDPECVKGYDKINDDSAASSAFLGTCAYSMSACSDDTSRWISSDTGPSCSSSCPLCDCDGNSAGDQWYQVVTPSFYPYALCMNCTCSSNSGTDYAQCQAISAVFGDNTACPPTTEITQGETITCHNQESNSGTKESPINTDTCSGWGSDITGSTSSKPYCSIEYDATEGDYQYDWECGETPFCEAYADNKCVHIQFEVSYTDCYDEIVTETTDEYLRCCDTYNCNYEDFSTEECSENAAWEELYTDFIECYYEANSPYYNYVCDEDVTEITCPALTKVFQHQAYCVCQLYGGVGAALGDDGRNVLEIALDSLFSQYSFYNAALECEINLECVLSDTGGVVTDSETGDTIDPDDFKDHGNHVGYFVALVW